MGNYHARFLGGNGAERPLTYPVLIKTTTYPGIVRGAQYAL